MDILDALIERLEGDEILCGLNGNGVSDGGMVNEIGHLNVGQDTDTPYIIVTDPSSRISYDFGGTGIEGGNFIIEAIADLESGGDSGQDITKRILKRVSELLQDSEIELVVEDGSVLSFRKMGRTSSRVITRSGNEQYLLRGCEWEAIVEYTN